MKSEKFKSAFSKGIITALMVTCLSFSLQAKPVDGPSGSDTTKTSKMDHKKPGKKDKMSDSKMEKKTDKMDKKTDKM